MSVLWAAPRLINAPAVNSVGGYDVVARLVGKCALKLWEKEGQIPHTIMSLIIAFMKKQTKSPASPKPKTTSPKKPKSALSKADKLKASQEAAGKRTLERIRQRDAFVAHLAARIAKFEQLQAIERATKSQASIRPNSDQAYDVVVPPHEGQSTRDC
jgi:HD superfamily phosphodiesterase